MVGNMTGVNLSQVAVENTVEVASASTGQEFEYIQSLFFLALLVFTVLVYVDLRIEDWSDSRLVCVAVHTGVLLQAAALGILLFHGGALI